MAYSSSMTYLEARLVLFLRWGRLQLEFSVKIEKTICQEKIHHPVYASSGNES